MSLLIPSIKMTTHPLAPGIHFTLIIMFSFSSYFKFKSTPHSPHSFKSSILDSFVQFDTEGFDSLEFVSIQDGLRDTISSSTKSKEL